MADEGQNINDDRPTYGPRLASPIVPVWISFPRLPSLLIHPGALYTVASLIGNPIGTDELTAKLENMYEPRVYVELDVSKPLTKSVWIGLGDRFFTQEVRYGKIPKFCSHCYRLGYHVNQCKGLDEENDDGKCKQETNLSNNPAKREGTWVESKSHKNTKKQKDKLVKVGNTDEEQVHERVWKSLPVFWEKPSDGVIKINTDGASKGNPGRSGAGGIARDSKGNVIFAYYSFLGHQTNNYAELWAIWEGLRIAIGKGYQDIWIETDSQFAIDLIKSERGTTWDHKQHDLLVKVRGFLNVASVRISHIYREGNVAADTLANMACGEGDSKYFDPQEIPAKLKGIVHVDKMNVPYLRYIDMVTFNYMNRFVSNFVLEKECVGVS